MVGAALLWAIAAAAFFAFVPTVIEQEGEPAIDSKGDLILNRHEITFLDAHGLWVTMLLLIPVVLAAVPLFRGRDSRVTTACGAAIAVLALITSFFWIGAYFMPAALLLLIGAGMVELRSET